MSTAIIYSFTSNKTAKAGEKIAAAIGKSLETTMVNADELTEKEFLSYDQLILGVPTWFDGELPHYWDEFVPAIEEMDLKGKKVAIYGLADQVGYPENFADGVGILARLIRDRGAEIVGQTNIENYKFESSNYLSNETFFKNRRLIIPNKNILDKLIFNLKLFIKNFCVSTLPW